MTDEATSPTQPAALPEDERPDGTAPTPEELLAETEPADPAVGIDGTGIGELP